MGKKSRKKKDRRSLPADKVGGSGASTSEKKAVKTSKAAKKTKKVEKPLKEKKAPKPPEQKAKSKENLNQKMKAGLLILIGAFLLVSAVALLYERIFKADHLAEYLPANDTFALIELNIEGSDATELEAIMQKYPIYNKSSISSQITSFLGADYETQIKPWVGRKIAFALVKMQEEVNPQVAALIFVEVKNFKQALDFFNSRKLENGEDALQIIEVEGQKLYEYQMGENIYFSFLDNYLVLSNKKENIATTINTATSKTKRLIESSKYHEIADNLPTNELAFGFFDLTNLTKYILSSPNFVMENGFILTSFEPFLAIFDAEGFSITTENEGLKIQTYTNFNRDLLEGKEFLSFKEKYNASLTKFINEDAMLVWGGSNLEKQLKRIADILAKGSEASTIIFDGILEAQKDIYLGKEVSLKQDLYPLIKNEFLIAVYDAEVPMVQVVLELEDLNNDLSKVNKIVDGFVKQNAFFKPEIREVVLEDGTVGQEIVGVPEDINKSEAEYNGQKLHTIQLGSKPWGIYYTVKGNKLILASAKEIIEEVIDGNTQNLANSKSFKTNLAPILKHADELSYVNLKKLLPHIWPTVEEGETSLTQLYLDPFLSVSSSKNYFKSGISTIHYIGLTD